VPRKNPTDLCRPHGAHTLASLLASVKWGGQKKNRTLNDLVNTMLDTSGLSKGMVGEAILITCHVLYRVSTKNKKITPGLFGSQPQFASQTLAATSCLAYVWFFWHTCSLPHFINYMANLSQS
jgi:hypothetical protein